MAQGSKGKSPHSGAHKEARKAITLRNKARRAKRHAKWLAKRQSKVGGKPVKATKRHAWMVNNGYAN